MERVIHVLIPPEMASDVVVRAGLEREVAGRIVWDARSAPGLMSLRVDRGGEDAAVARARQLPFVRDAGRAGIGRFASTFPNDPGFPSQWSLHSQTHPGHIRMPEAWDLQTAVSSEIVIAVVDDGVYYNHPDLIDNMWVNPGEWGDDGNGGRKETNGIDDDGNGFKDDVHGANMYPDTFCAGEPAEGDPVNTHVEQHGTTIAAIIGARGNNGYALAGIAWECKIMAVRTSREPFCGLPPGAPQLVRALDYALANGARIVNCSWWFAYDDLALRTLCEKARDKGVILVAAAGNKNINIDAPPVPSLWYPQLYDYDNIVVVASTVQSGERWVSSPTLGSNWGPVSVDFAAPGHDIPVLPTFTQNPSEPFPYAPSDPFVGGTSFAAPHVAAVLGLVWSKHPNLTYDQVIARVARSGPAEPTLCGITVFGRRLDAFRAITNDRAPPCP